MFVASLEGTQETKIICFVSVYFANLLTSVKNFKLVLLNLGSLALNYVITYNGYVVILRGFRETQCTTMLMIELPFCSFSCFMNPYVYCRYMEILFSSVAIQSAI